MSSTIKEKGHQSQRESFMPYAFHASTKTYPRGRIPCVHITMTIYHTTDRLPACLSMTSMRDAFCLFVCWFVCWFFDCYNFEMATGPFLFKITTRECKECTHIYNALLTLGSSSLPRLQRQNVRVGDSCRQVVAVRCLERTLSQPGSTSNMCSIGST